METLATLATLARGWLAPSLAMLWWSCGILGMRTLALAVARQRGRARRLTSWTALLALANLAVPFVVGDLLGLPLPLLAALTGALALLDAASILAHRDWSVVGAQSYVAVPVVAVAFAAYALAVSLTTPMIWLGYALSLLLIVAELISCGIDLYYTGELLDVICRTTWRARMVPWHGDPPAAYPKVSVHVPAHDEDPDQVMRTLAALTRLDYPSYEIVMVDDNTEDAARWRPVMGFCRAHGIKVMHLMQYPGYKAGALNFALQQTDPAAELIAVVDADYVVRPEWLKETVPYFLGDPRLAFLQTPQAFTYPPGDAYHHANALAEHYFFAIGMPSRAERNSLIFCGTMGLMRRRVLERIGGWAEWCVTEDAEASLRVLARGYRGAYLPVVYGRGVLPPAIAQLKRQHYRWAFGSIKLSRAYLGLLLFRRGRRYGDPRYEAYAGKRPTLTRRQRYDYVMHGAHWYHALLQIGLGVLLNAVALLHVFHVPFTLRPLIAAALVLPVLGVGTGVARVLWSTRVVMGGTRREAWAVLLGLLCVQWAVARACVAGLYRRRLPFYRTPKARERVTIGRALRMTATECLLTLVALATIGLLLWQGVTWENVLLSVLLLWHALVMSAAPLLALIHAVSDARPRRDRAASGQQVLMAGSMASLGAAEPAEA